MIILWIFIAVLMFVVLYPIECKHPKTKDILKTKHGTLVQCTRCGKTWTE